MKVSVIRIYLGVYLLPKADSWLQLRRSGEYFRVSLLREGWFQKQEVKEYESSQKAHLAKEKPSRLSEISFFCVYHDY